MRRENCYLPITLLGRIFDEVLFERLARWQNSINQDGYYPKDRDTGQIVVKDNNLKGDN